MFSVVYLKVDVKQTPYILSFLSWSVYLLVTEQCDGHTTGIMDVMYVHLAFRLFSMKGHAFSPF